MAESQFAAAASPLEVKEVKSGSGSTQEDYEAASVASDGSTIVDGSVISTVPDRYGFIGGTQYSTEPRNGPSAEVVLRREHKWLKMLSRYNFYMEKNYKKIRERCRKGIPMSVRPKAWAYLCGGIMLMEKYPERYKLCLQMEADSKAVDDIKKDLHRQFPFHEMFCSDDRPGQKELFNVLQAYVVYNPEVGYCQAQGPVAAFLLMHMPAEQAFWCLVSICDKYLSNYYSPSMEIVQRDGLMLQALLKRVCAPAYRHLKKVSAEPIYYCTEWFLCAFTRTLPWGSLLRIWDIFLLDLLRNPPEEVLTEDYLVEHVLKLNLSEQDFIEEDLKLKVKLRKMKEKDLKDKEKEKNAR